MSFSFCTSSTFFPILSLSGNLLLFEPVRSGTPTHVKQAGDDAHQVLHPREPNASSKVEEYRDET
jgi:hypothetical protein